MPSRSGAEKPLDPSAAVGRLLGQASLGDQRQRSAKDNLVKGRRGTSRGSRQRPWERDQGAECVGTLSSTDPALSSPAGAAAPPGGRLSTPPGTISPQLVQEVSWVVCAESRIHLLFKVKKKKNLPEQQASGSQRINNGLSSSEPQMEREGGSLHMRPPPHQSQGHQLGGHGGTEGRLPGARVREGLPLLGPSRGLL